MVEDMYPIFRMTFDLNNTPYLLVATPPVTPAVSSITSACMIGTRRRGDAISITARITKPYETPWTLSVGTVYTEVRYATVTVPAI
jgi:hypothetical protein